MAGLIMGIFWLTIYYSVWEQGVGIDAKNSIGSTWKNFLISTSFGGFIAPNYVFGQEFYD
jgi:hypothetical protein